MLGLLSQTVTHIRKGIFGGITLGTVIIRKKKALFGYNNNDSKIDLQRNVKHPVLSESCHGCISYDRNVCYFAFRNFPKCFLSR